MGVEDAGYALGQVCSHGLLFTLYILAHCREQLSPVPQGALNVFAGRLGHIVQFATITDPAIANPDPGCTPDARDPIVAPRGLL